MTDTNQGNERQGKISRADILLFLTVFVLSPGQAQSETLNLNFIHGNNPAQAPAILRDDVRYPPGQYIVDIYFNRQKTHRQILYIRPDDTRELCLTEGWLHQARLPLDLKKMKKQPGVWNAVRQCLYPGRYPAGKVQFDYGTQALYISEPQVILADSVSEKHWDYGIPGFRLSYATNASKGQGNQTQYYGNFNFSANLGPWVLSSNSTGFSGQGFQSPQAMISTAIAPLRGNLELGKTRTRSTLMPDFSFYGLTLRSDSSMVPWSVRGYAPVISGVAASHARITISQGNYTLSSQVVPPGPYALNNITPIGNGMLTVTVEEEDGSRTVRTYPVTTLPTLLRAGDFNYNLSAGTRSDEGRVKGIFALGSLDYGFAPLTLNLATILHPQYQAAGIGGTRNLGIMGAIELSTNVSRSVYDTPQVHPAENSPPGDDHVERPPLFFPPQGYDDRRYYRHGSYMPAGPRTGISATLKYARSFGENTNLQLLSYRYAGERYVDFTEFDPTQHWRDEVRKSRYEVMITQNMEDITLNLSGWTQNYRQRPGNDTGLNASISTSIKGMALGLNGSYSKAPQMSDEYSVSLSISVPFSVFDARHFSSSSAVYSRDSGTQFSSSVSGNPSDNLTWNASVGAGRDSRNTSASVGYTFDAMQTGASVTQYRSYHGESQTMGSLSASGSVLGTLKSGMLFTREQNDTVALVKIKDIPGVTFNGSRPTDNQGITAVSLSPYSRNDIRINTGNVPDNMELLDSVQTVVPTQHAIIFREFNYAEVKRYILRVRNRNGEPLPQGTTALTQNGLDAGFVTRGGILLASLLAKPDTLTLTSPQGKTCRVNMAGINPGNTITEVHCE
ncbi:fimbria/pilus outer membrane usher protein [Salmonella enterica]